jgi:putative ATP-dependent endonuclease of the OLD family
LLLGSEEDGLPLLLIEEPEAHLHPQRQLRLMQFLQEQVGIERPDKQKIQIIVTTHSPNLASAIKLDNLVLVQAGKAFSLADGETALSGSDYRFLERFLDVTKANLFFARGVVIVEGDGENILLPALARLIGRDFGAHGVSIVNVGGTGLRRFARIFQRKRPEEDGTINVPVACVTDLDVMPDCAPVIFGRVKAGEALPEKRRWRVRSDFKGTGLEDRREEIRGKASAQNVETFVSNEWTLEYDVAHAGLAEDVWIAAHLALFDEQINANKTDRATVQSDAEASFAALNAKGKSKEELASHIYALFAVGSQASKAVTAQYLAERLEKRVKEGALTQQDLKENLPRYLVAAIEYVTPLESEEGAAQTDDGAKASAAEAGTGVAS